MSRFTKKRDFCDDTLGWEDKQTKTHKLVITSFSPVLAKIFKLIQTPHPVIYLIKVKYRDFQNFMNVIYKGKANVSEEDLNNFHEIAEDLNVRGLCERNIDSYESNEEVSSIVPHKVLILLRRGIKLWMNV